MIHVITIPNWHPPLTNTWVGKHWSKKYKLRRAATQMISAYALVCNAPMAKGRCRRVSLRVSWNKPGRIPDSDAFTKLFLDALVNTGLLSDDNRDGLDGFEVEIVRDNKLETVIELEDVCS